LLAFTIQEFRPKKLAKRLESTVRDLSSLPIKLANLFDLWSVTKIENPEANYR
jgi:hypothetical protein